MRKKQRKKQRYKRQKGGILSDLFGYAAMSAGRKIAKVGRKIAKVGRKGYRVFN